LRRLLGAFRHSVALNDLNIEINVGVEWDWLTTKRGVSVGTTIGVVGWAIKCGFVTLMKLLNCEVPAVENFSVTEREDLWHTS